VAFVKVDKDYWNLNSIARLSRVDDPTKLGWASWVAGIITLASGKEFGVSQEDYDAIVSLITYQDKGEIHV
jgi:hypothetical protein